jgi:hypothetical protein
MDAVQRDRSASCMYDLSSSSLPNKDIGQLRVWEWTSYWQILLMITEVLSLNGFFTEELNIDSYPRLILTLICVVSYLIHPF